MTTNQLIHYDLCIELQHDTRLQCTLSCKIKICKYFHTISDSDDCATHDCEDICVDGFFMFTCACSEGFYLSDDRKSCDGNTSIDKATFYPYFC